MMSINQNLYKTYISRCLVQTSMIMYNTLMYLILDDMASSSYSLEQSLSKDESREESHIQTQNLKTKDENDIVVIEDRREDQQQDHATHVETSGM